MDDRSPKQVARSRFDRGVRGSRPRRDRGPSGDLRTQRGATPTASVTQNRTVDVFCSGMYRACSTWQYEVVAHILERHVDGRRLGYLSGQQYQEHLRRNEVGATPPETAWRVLKSHEGDRIFSRALAEGRGLAVYAFRDVRDVVFSLMHKRGLTFEQLLRQGMIHQVLANDRFWMRQPGVFVQRYEEILADPVGSVRDLAGYLGIELEDGEAERIAGEYSLESNKARTEALRRRLEQVGVDLNEAANAQICDSTTLLHWNHVRSGRAGCWYDEATPHQRWILGRLCGRWLKARDYPLIPAGCEIGPSADPTISLRERLRIEADLIVARLNYLARMASQRFPGLAITIKRLMGIPTPDRVGAQVFSDSRPESPVGTSSR